MKEIPDKHQSCSPRWVRSILRKVRDQPGIASEERVNDLKGAGTTVTKKPIGIRRGLRCCSGCKVSPLKKAHAQAHLKFAREHLNDSEKVWENAIW